MALPSLIRDPTFADMPHVYRRHMVAMAFPPAQAQSPRPLEERLLRALSREDAKRLKAARASFK